MSSEDNKQPKAAPDNGQDSTQSSEHSGGIFALFFAIPDLIIKVHLLIGALLFPYAFRMPKAEYEGPTPPYQLWCLVCGCIILAINLFGVFAVLDLLFFALKPVLDVLGNWELVRHQPNTLLSASLQVNFIQLAKFSFVFLAWIFSLTAIIVVNNEKMISALLYAVEEEASQTRDESVMLIRAGQAGLRGMNAKLWGEEQHIVSPSDLIRSIGPLALLFFNKEKNLFAWGMAGAKAVAKGVKFLQQISK